ncbi:hypothetical protein, partial [Streptomyces sp. SBT349]|uniref:hypothetical protein n=1 Tax=Streptomyces sp. SBT349 TaxID=1580539 RepID=UPI000A544F24
RLPQATLSLDPPPGPPGGPLPPPPPPSLPPTAGMPRDPGTAATAALLNLSGLGLGYLYLRRWRRAIPSWLVTGLLLYVALPVTAEGIDGLWVVLYGVWLLLAAADAYRVAGPSLPGRTRRWIPLTAGALLLALPAASVVFFNDAQRQALEDDLQELLAAADAEVERANQSGFEEERYRDPLDVYLGVRADHPDTDAAGEVPERLDALYEGATAERTGEDHCTSLDPLRFFSELPGDIDDSEAERLSGQAASDLPEPLHGCGLQRIAEADAAAAGEPLTELLEDHPESEYATGLPQELGDRQRGAIDGIGGDQPCASFDELRTLNGLFGRLPGAEFTQLADEGAGPVPEGLYQCGTFNFLGGQYATSDTHLNELVEDYPDHERVEHARDILIASQIAAEYAPAGEQLPPEPGSAGAATVTVEILNDSPDELEILWTGPTTGSESVGPCGSCSVYPSDPGDASCSSSGYPTVTLELPAGDYHFMHRSPGLDIRTLTETETLSSDFIYTWCSFTTEQDFLSPELPVIPEIPEIPDV